MKTEPVLLVTAIMSVLYAFVAFGLDVTTEQSTAVQVALTAVFAAVGAVWARSKVSPVEPPHDIEHKR